MNQKHFKKQKKSLYAIAPQKITSTFKFFQHLIIPILGSTGNRATRSSSKNKGISNKLWMLFLLSGGTSLNYYILDAIAPSQAWAGNLEFSSGSYPGVPTGPSTADQTVTFQDNTVEPGTFAAYTPAITLKASISNQKYTNGLTFGAAGSSGVPTFRPMNAIATPANNMFTASPNGTPGTQVSVADNYAFELFSNVDPLIGQALNGKYYYADLTLTFSRPVSDPVIHMTGMGGSYGTHGHTSEFELITPGITPSKLSGSPTLNITGNNITNSATTVGATCPAVGGSSASGAACGSVKFSGTNITELKFKVYVRGDGLGSAWSTSGAYNGDVFLFGGASVAKPVTISGTVFDDANGLTGGISGTGANASGLFANLLDSTSKVVASTSVAANGTYSFQAIGAGNYTVSLSTTAGVQGTTAPASSLPSNWISIGEGTVAGGDGTVDGRTAITVAAADVTGVNFGIEQLPSTTDLNPASQTNPGGTATVQVPTFAGTDPEDGSLGSGKSFKIVTLPTNGTLTYNNSPVTAKQVISTYDPTLLKLDPNDGVSNVSFTYAAVDAAGKEDPTPATVSMPFAAPPPNFGMCPTPAYITQGTSTSNIKLNSADLLTGVLTPISAAPFANGVNAIGFSQKDGYIYGIESGSNHVMRIDANGVGYDLGAIAGLPIPADSVSGYVIGDVNANGVLHIIAEGGSTIYAIDVNPASPTYLTLLKSNSVSLGNIYDMAFNPLNGNLYTVQASTSKVFEIVLPSGTGAATVNDRGKPTVLPTGSVPYGAIFFASDGSMYAYRNGTSGGTDGQIYQITNVAGTGLPVATVLTTTAAGVGKNDGARCAMAPPILPGVTVSGTVWNDANGNAILAAPEAGTEAGSSTLTVYAVDSSGYVLDKSDVAAVGTYSLSVPKNANGVTLRLSNDATKTVGQVAPTAASLPSGWINTGENKNGTTEFTTLGDIAIATTTSNIPNQNFGIEQLPNTTDLTPASQINPGGTATVQVTTLAGTDTEDGVLGSGKTFKIVTLPSNGILYYNGAAVTAGQVIKSYDPTKLAIDPNDGTITVSFTYSAVDAAGKEDPTPATVSMPFTATVAACVNSAGDGSYATTGINKNSIWWLNWECYNDSIANTTAGQPFSFTLPDGSTLTTTVKRTGSEAVIVTNAPSWGGAAIGNGQYNGIAGKPIFYSKDYATSILSWQESLTNIVVTDKAGNPRNYTFVTADGESTDQQNGGYNERLTFTTNGVPWNLVELISQSGSVAPTTSSSLAGVGTTSATWTAPRTNNNGSVILSTNSPSNIASASTPQGTNSGGKQGVFFGLGLPKIKLIKNIGGRVAAGDQFTTQIAYTAPTVVLASATSTGTATGISTGATSVLPGNVITLSETMAAGSVSPLSAYNASISCTNANATPTQLPSGSGKTFSVIPQIGDDITCTLTNKPTNANVLLVKRITAINGTAINKYVDDTTSAKKDDDSHPNWPAPLNSDNNLGDTTISSFLRGLIDGGTVKPDDEVEYTIYFLATGNSPATNVNFCDLVPANVTFIPTAFTKKTPGDGGIAGADAGIQLTIGNRTTYLTNVADGDRGEYFAPGTTTSVKCPSGNSNGAVVVKVVNSQAPAPNDELPNATAPGTPTGSYGFIRFWGRVK